VFVAEVPSFRRDVRIKEDIFSEVARGYGYDRIQSALPRLFPQGIEDRLYIFKRELRDFLARLGLNEIITYSINGEDKLKSLGEDNYIKLDNPLRKEANTLRTTLVTGMCEAVEYNLNQKNSPLRFFEIAHIYRKISNGFLELPFLGSVVTDTGGGFLYLKSVAQAIIEFLNIEVEDVEFIEYSQDNFSSMLKINYKNTNLGFLGKLSRFAAQVFGIKTGVSYLQMDVKAMALLRKKQAYKHFSRYPAMARDISLGLEAGVKFQQIAGIIKEAAGSYLDHYQVIDIYKGKDEAGEFIMFTLRIYYHAPDKTLTSVEVDTCHFRLRERLVSHKGVMLR